MSLKAAALNDHISPGLECIKPAKVQDVKGTAQRSIGYGDKLGQAEVTGTLRVAQVSLKDCLACSGCITSAEAVLVEKQTHLELLKTVEGFKRGTSEIERVVVSLSPQSRIAFAAHKGISQAQAARLITAYCRNRLSASQVWDTSLANDISLIESTSEFLDRHGDQKHGKAGALPMLASSCPGWICYAEKMQKDILPLISRTKSAQQVMGSFLKHGLMDSRKGTVFHVAIMPCYDKKLEAMREQHDGDVDMVITTSELEDMMEGWDREVEIETGHFRLDPQGTLSRNEGSASGGFLEHIVRHAMPILMQEPFEVSTKAFRSEDYTEVCVTAAGEATPRYRFAYVYGFRNIQNLVRKLKGPRKVQYDFVEVMACPKGCLNGGGQEDAKLDNRERKDRVSKMSAQFSELPAESVTRDSMPRYSNDLFEWYAQLSQTGSKVLQTDYRAVPEDDFSMGVVW